MATSDAKQRHYICDITEANGSYEYVRVFLMVCEAGENEAEKVDAMLLAYRGTGERDDDGRVYYDGHLTGLVTRCDEITASDYEVMNRHLEPLDVAG